MRLNNAVLRVAFTGIRMTEEKDTGYLAMAQEAEARAEESKTAQAREVWLYVARSYRELAHNPDR